MPTPSPHQNLSGKKKNWVDLCWLDNSTLAFLSGEALGFLPIGQAEPDKPKTIEVPITSSLEPDGSRFLLLDHKIFLLTKDGLELQQWDDSGDTRPHFTLALTGPATGLNFDRQNRCISWVQEEQTQGFAIWCHNLSQRTTAAVLNPRLDGVPYGMSWHPTRRLIMALLSPRDQLPWHGARLHLAEYSYDHELPQIERWDPISPPSPGTSLCAEAQFSPCGQSILGLWLTEEWFQFWSYSLNTKNWRQLSFTEGERAEPLRRWGQQSLVFGPGQELIGIRTVAGVSHLESFSSEAGSKTKGNPIALQATALHDLGISPDKKRLSVIGASLQLPPRIIILSHQPDGKWTEGDSSSVSPQLRMEQVSWQSKDGQTAYGLLFLPLESKGPLPLIMPIHGGPCEQVKATWPIKALRFVNLGYAVLYVNYRGSWGYGKSYHHSLAGRWGEAELLDIVSAPEAMAQQGFVDPNRVALWGGDIGASSVLHTLHTFPHVFQAAVAVYPLCDLADYRQRTTEIKKLELDWAIGNSSQAAYAQRSPLHYAEKIITPLALFHGNDDTLVPAKHIEMLSESLKKRGIPVFLKSYPDEAHSWQKQETFNDYYACIEAFFDQFLRASYR